MTSLFNAILGDPYRRTKTMYHFKVSSVTGNTIAFHDASKVTNRVELPNNTPYTLEHLYGQHIDNLFLAISVTGQYFFYTKLSNDANWPDFER